MSSPNHPSKARFQSTQWDLVMTAQQRSSSSGQRAFAELCEAYWYPLYAHARLRERDAHRASDLIQGFFAKVMEKNYLTDADPRRGRFRTFLLASFGNYVANERDRVQTRKRGGDNRHVSFDLIEGEQRYQAEPADEMTAEKQFELLWARALLKQVLDRLSDTYRAANKQAEFDELQPCLTRSAADNYTAIGQRLGMTEGAVKAAVHRLKKRFREILRDEVSKTVADPQEVDDEIHQLFETFSQ